jgi:hypothetical protein
MEASSPVPEAGPPTLPPGGKPGRQDKAPFGHSLIGSA